MQVNGWWGISDKPTSTSLGDSWCFQDRFGIFGEFYVTTERYATMTGTTGEQESGVG